MKLSHALAIGTMMALVAPTVFAGSTANLAVVGTIVPTSCEPRLGTPTVNFGKLSSADLIEDDFYRPPTTKTQMLQVTCQSATRFALRGIDNRSGTVPDEYPNASGMDIYGLGLTAKNEKIGAHFIKLKREGSSIDGVPMFFTAGGAGFWTASSAQDRALPLATRGIVGANTEQGSTQGPSQAQVTRFIMESRVVIAPAKNLTLTDDIALDGSATIELVYL